MLIQRDVVVVVYPNEPRFDEIVSWCSSFAQAFHLVDGGRLFVMDDATFDRFAIVHAVVDRKQDPLNSAKLRRKRS